MVDDVWACIPEEVLNNHKDEYQFKMPYFVRMFRADYIFHKWAYREKAGEYEYLIIMEHKYDFTKVFITKERYSSWTVETLKEPLYKFWSELVGDNCFTLKRAHCIGYPEDEEGELEKLIEDLGLDPEGEDGPLHL